MRGLKEWKGVEWGDGGEVGSGFVRDFLELDFEGVDDGLNFSVPVVDGGLGAEVQFHDSLLIKSVKI